MKNLRNFARKIAHFTKRLMLYIVVFVLVAVDAGGCPSGCSPHSVEGGTMHARGRCQLGLSDRCKVKATSLEGGYMSLHKKPPPSPLEVCTLRSHNS